MPFIYHSEQIHADYKNGKGQTRRNSVTIRNKKGTKTVEVLNAKGKTIKKRIHSLTKKEIAKIRKNQFIPGLFAASNTLK